MDRKVDFSCFHEQPSGGKSNPELLIYRNLFEHAPVEVHIWRLDRDREGRIRTWRLVDANPAALAVWGRDIDEIVGLTTDEIFPDANATETFMPLVEEIFSTGRPKSWEQEFSGTDQVLHMTTIPVGEYFISTGSDVTEVRRQKRKLDETLESLDQATRAGGVGLWDWDLETDRVHYSRQWKRQLGYGPAEISDELEEARSRLHPDDRDRTMESVYALSNEEQGTTTEVEFRMQHRDGTWRWFRAQASFIAGDGSRPARIVGTTIDITNRRRIEEQLLESQKLEALATLASGLAHDFNNLLTAIIGNLSLLRNRSRTAAERQVFLSEVENAARQAEAITSRLFTFSKGGTLALEVASIKQLIVDAASFMVRGTGVRCEFDIDDELANVEADSGQISQVLQNLVINAEEAMPEGGTIQVSAANVAMSHGNSVGLSAGAYVRISVKDEGAGMSHEVQQRIFDPFFSTKNRGSGLGLSSSYSIVKEHGGKLLVDSKPGCGSTFHVYLPASSEPETPRQPASVMAGTGRILVMDDEPAVQQFLQHALEGLGYGCDTAADGAQAAELYKQALACDRAYDAVILDLTIPGTSGGKEVLKHLREIDPEVAAIVTSGYANDDVLANYRRHGFVGRIRKPMDEATLSMEIARVLAAR